MSVIGTFIIDFQTTEFERDGKIAGEFLASLQGECKLQNAYAIDEPLERAGWAFAKMFLAGEFVECIYEKQRQQVDSTKGKKFEDKFIGWIALRLKERGCRATVKMAPEMKKSSF